MFRGLDIGSAKVEPHLQEEIPHHVIDVVGVKEKFSAGDFRDRAMRAIQVGGGGLCFCLEVCSSY